MATPRPRPEPRRPRRGSIERPVGGRLYRSSWLLVLLPLAAAAFAVFRPTPLPAPELPPAFDAAAAAAQARELARLYPDRSPGTRGAEGAARWVAARLAADGLRVRSSSFRARVPGRGVVTLRNLTAVVPGQSQQALVVSAHRDNSGAGPGAVDNASGTAALLELARSYGNPGPEGQRVTPAHTLVFVSTDGGVFGGLGARHFALHSAFRGRTLAAVALDALAGRGQARVVFNGSRPRNAAPELVETASARVAESTARAAAHAGVGAQLLDLAFPFSLYPQAPLVGARIPAVTLTTQGGRHLDGPRDTPERLSERRLGELGRAAEGLVESLDAGAELVGGTQPYLLLGARIVPGWAVESVLVAALLPFLVAAVDLFALTRRRRIPLAPALRSLRSRAGVWLFVAAAFELFRVLGWWPAAPAVPLDPASAAAGDWPRLALAGLAAVGACAWLLARERLAPRRPAAAEEELAGHVAALLALGVVALLVVVANPFALVFCLPSLHAWLWLPQVRSARAGARAAVLALGLAGPALLVAAFAVRYGLGFDAPWYLAELAANGYVPVFALAIGALWTAAAAQLVALAAGRYAPYPERPPRGPVRRVVRAAVLARRRARAGRRAPDSAARAFYGR